MSPRYRLFRRTMILLCRLLFGYTLHGGERVPAEGPLIVASNHSQYADPVLVCVAVPRRLQWMAQKAALRLPVQTVLPASSGPSPSTARVGEGPPYAPPSPSWPKVGRSGSSPRAPTGATRVPGRPRAGSSCSRSRGNAPVLPVHVGRLPGPLGRLRGERLHIYVGEPIELDPALRGGAAYRAAADEIMRSIYALPERLGRPIRGEAASRRRRRRGAQRRQELAGEQDHAPPRRRGLRATRNDARQGLQPGRVGRQASSPWWTRAGWSRVRRSASRRS